MQTYSDKDIFSLLGDGETKVAQAALVEMYRRYSSRIYSYCRKIVGDDHIAEDMLQETFMKLLEASRKKSNIENIFGYLLIIARNHCLNYKRDNTVMFDELQDMHLTTSENTFETKELVHLITMSLELLPEHYREAFVLREYNGLSYAEVGETVGQPVNVVKVRIHRAKEKLRQILAPYFSEMNHQA